MAGVIWEDERNGNWNIYTTSVDSSRRIGIEERDNRWKILDDGVYFYRLKTEEHKATKKFL